MSLTAFREDLANAKILVTSSADQTITLPADVADAITGVKQDVFYRLVISGQVTAINIGAVASLTTTPVLPATFFDAIPMKYPAGVYHFIGASSGTACFIPCYPTF